MDDEYPDIAKICRAPNDKFYVLWQGQAVCTGNCKIVAFVDCATVALAICESLLFRSGQGHGSDAFTFVSRLPT